MTTAQQMTVMMVLAAALSCQRDKASPKPSGSGTLPGAEPLSKALLARLESAVIARGPDYVPRTMHKDASGKAIYTNRLALESSPYLLQHSHNPVNWYPWGDEAFEAAARLGRPVLISIGYSTCHWCHVMEEESFEDVEIAGYLNANYIAIKVDREERPDVDSVYMSALHAMGQSGGWPLNVWVTPDRKPFFGGTYFPPRSGVRGARIGFREILERAVSEFRDNREKLSESADRLAEAIARANAPTGGAGSIPTGAFVEAVARKFLERRDRAEGGVLPSSRDRSKFPSSFPNRLMLRVARRTADAELAREAREAVALTLSKMARGGMYDQIGGGFHRYSTDPSWLVPHFEKMLYDNALLVVTYLEAYQALGKRELASVATDILAYTAREMRSADGGFYSATDADSVNQNGHREEGAFFVWTPDQLTAALGAEDGKLAIAVYGATPKGNWEGHTILNLPRPLAAVAAELGISETVLRRRLAGVRTRLLSVRASRSPPLRDDKILAAWNGLMLSAYARAAAVLGDELAPRPPARGVGLEPGAIAASLATFITDKLVVDGKLRRAYKDGKAYGDAYAEDYAFVIAGLIELFEAAGDPRWLEQAITLQTQLDAHYSASSGVYYKSAAFAEKLLAREIPDRDGALPSANSVAALNLLRLYQLTSEPAYLERADRLLASFAPTLAEQPASLAEMLLAVDYRDDTPKQIVLTGTTDGFGPLLATLRGVYVPSSVVVRKRPAAPERLGELVGLSAAKEALDGKPTAYVCEDSRCELPTSDPARFAKQLGKIMPFKKVEAPAPGDQK